ncbi:MAG: hypothetical protein PWQ37_1881 [Candidatus Petromonas sp.]|jgi:cyclic lactone autoinducer peptide|nr:hypothetical protein [Candidatus Petromonas sp.]
MLRKLLQLSIAVLTFIAFSNVAAATSTIGYQPELPEQLREE